MATYKKQLIHLKPENIANYAELQQSVNRQCQEQFMLKRAAQLVDIAKKALHSSHMPSKQVTAPINFVAPDCLPALIQYVLAALGPDTHQIEQTATQLIISIK